MSNSEYIEKNMRIEYKKNIKIFAEKEEDAIKYVDEELKKPKENYENSIEKIVTENLNKNCNNESVKHKLLRKVYSPDIFDDIESLRKNIITKLKKYQFDDSTSYDIAIDIIWDEDFFNMFLLQYFNKNFVHLGYLDKHIRNSFATYIYNRYMITTKENRYNGYYLDNECSRDILDDNRIVNTIFYIGEDISNYTHLCRKLSYMLYEFFIRENILSINEYNIWFLTKGLIKYILLSDIDNKTILFNKVSSNIENNINMKIPYDALNRFVDDKLIIESLKNNINWKNKDFIIA